MNKKTLALLISGFFLFLILVLGYFLRIKNYTKIPAPGESTDEYSFTWLGLSLLEVGKPMAESGLAPYSPVLKYINVDDFYHKNYSPNPAAIVYPWFDHPPILGLITGGYSYLKGVRNFADASVSFIRKPMVIIGVLNIFLLFIFVNQIAGIKAAFVSSLIYATEPLIVISSRMAQAENLLITLFLSSLIFLHSFFKTKKNVYFWIAVTLAGIATLTKFSGWSIAVSLLLLTLASDLKNKVKLSITMFLGISLMFLLFPVYGYLYNWHLFIQIFSSNSTRVLGDGIGILTTFLFKQNITKTFGSGWVPLGWISLCLITYLNSKKLEKYWLIIPVVSYLLIYLILGSQGYGWYKFPFLPFIISAIGVVLIETLESPNLIFNLLFIFLPGAFMLNRFIDSNYLSAHLWLFRSAMVLVFGIIILKYVFTKKKVVKYVYIGLISIIFVVLIGLNVYTNLKINTDSWYNSNWIQSLSQ